MLKLTEVILKNIGEFAEEYISENWIETEEGEETFYFWYDNPELLIKSAEKYIDKPVNEWINYNKTYNLWNFPECESDVWKRLYLDLQNHSLEFSGKFQ
ncbi:MAG: hypothetical protein K2G83_07515 [Ruminococcus sp.]|nr:hypothetical protein [Ruminococcus sp.]